MASRVTASSRPSDRPPVTIQCDAVNCSRRRRVLWVSTNVWSRGATTASRGGGRSPAHCPVGPLQCGAPPSLRPQPPARLTSSSLCLFPASHTWPLSLLSTMCPRSPRAAARAASGHGWPRGPRSAAWRPLPTRGRATGRVLAVASEAAGHAHVRALANVRVLSAGATRPAPPRPRPQHEPASRPLRVPVDTARDQAPAVSPFSFKW